MRPFRIITYDLPLLVCLLNEPPPTVVEASASPSTSSGTQATTVSVYTSVFLGSVWTRIKVAKGLPSSAPSMTWRSVVEKFYGTSLPVVTVVEINGSHTSNGMAVAAASWSPPPRPPCSSSAYFTHRRRYWTHELSGLNLKLVLRGYLGEAEYNPRYWNGPSWAGVKWTIN